MKISGSLILRLVRDVVIAGASLAILLGLLVPATSNLALLKEPGSLSSPLALRPLSIPSNIYAADGSLMYTVGNGQFIQPVTLGQISHYGVKAVLDVEDHAFYIHGALDLRSIFRAVTADASGGAGLQGGSTITQQLVKNAILTPQRTLSRKIHEAVLAYRLEGQMSRQQILQDYLNTVYFGEGAYGIGAAAKTFFNIPPSQLDASQAALLAILIEDPSGLDPFFNPKASMFRRNLALQQMAKYGDLTQAQVAQYSKEPLPTVSHRPPILSPTGFSADVEYQLLNSSKYDFLGATPAARLQSLDNGGYNIYTTLQPHLQALADQAVASRLPNTGGRFTAALVSVNPANGYVEDLVSGNPLGGAGGYDVVTGRGGTGRQPGSTFKLFTLMAALQQGYSPNDRIDGTAPCTFTIPHVVPNPYIAHNAEPGLGIVSITKATADSINCAYIRLGVNVGLNNVVAMAHLLGVTSPVPAVPSMVIGSIDVTPLEMASAYATVDDLGIYHKPVFITKITNSVGRAVFVHHDTGRQVISAQLCKEAISVLQQVIAVGTGTGGNIGRPAAGKTGTTDNFTDGWFDGFTPQLVTSVWMGAPAGSIPMRPPATPEVVYGGTYPTSIWQDFMSQAMANLPVLSFPPAGPYPPGKFIVPIDSPGSLTSAPSPTTTAPPPTTSAPSPTTTAPASTTATSSSTTTTAAPTAPTTTSSTTTTTAPTSTTTTSSTTTAATPTSAG